MKPSPRTLSIGGATYDLFVRTGSEIKGTSGELQLPIGAKIRVQDVIETCGGGASNTSVGLQRLGCSAAFGGILGSDQWGERLVENLKREGVDITTATIVHGETSSFSIILSISSGERVILYASGTNMHLHDANFDKATAASVDWIYLNHLHEQGCMIEDDLCALLQEKDAPGLTWNPGGPQIKRGMTSPESRELLSVTTLLLCNKEEALAFTGVKDTEHALHMLLDAGAKTVCITDGGRGTLAGSGNTWYHCPTVENAEIIDTTGAGDAFGTGMTWGLLSQLDLPEALRAGTINATSVLGTIGAQEGLLTDIEMRKKLTSTRLDVREVPKR